MNLVCNRILFGLKFFRRHSQNFDRLALIEFLQTNPLAIPEFNSIPVSRSFCRELPERYEFFL